MPRHETLLTRPKSIIEEIADSTPESSRNVDGVRETGEERPARGSDAKSEFIDSVRDPIDSVATSHDAAKERPTVSKFKGLYSVKEEKSSVPPFAVATASGCRVETECGTVYWLGCPDDEGIRDVMREPSPGGTSATMIVQKPTAHPKNHEISEKFRGKLKSDVEVGMSLALEVSGEASRILSEVVVKIEPGNVPEEIFR